MITACDPASRHYYEFAPKILDRGYNQSQHCLRLTF